MKNMIIKRTSLFPASKQIVFTKLKELKTLQYIAYPYASFYPQSGNNDIQWTVNEVFTFNFKLFNIIPFGIHTIKVIEFDENKFSIYTHESNTHVPIWNHKIYLTSINENSILYTDEVEINAGWKTIFIYLWANCFYAHRQRKWIKLLSSNQNKL